MMRKHFRAVADAACARLTGDEVLTLSFAGEQSDFVRFSRSAIRQAGRVEDRVLTLDLVAGRRHARHALTLAGDLEEDGRRIGALLADLREARAAAPEDPHLLYATEVRSSDEVRGGAAPDAGAHVAAIRSAGRGRDLVGIYAAGRVARGFASSLGQRNWFEAPSFNLDWSFHLEADRAVKANYAGFEWDDGAFAGRVDRAARDLDGVARPARTVPPGRYRVYLAPAALAEVIGLLGWGGFGLKSHRTKQTPLLRMIEEGARLGAGVTIRENTAGGTAPGFQEQGFLRPDRVDLVVGGAYRDCLVSPRSAREYGVETNGASAGEAPESVDVAAGDLPADGVLRELGTGVYVANLWYLNFSDRAAGRITGMTRFATFWVEGGEIAAPLSVMRFDETVYRMLGENLVGLTRDRERFLDPDTYFRRSTASAHLPGALVDDFTFTL